MKRLRKDAHKDVHMTNRWTDETEINVAQSLHLGACDGPNWTACPFWTHHLERARAVLATLADAGLLVEPEIRTEPMTAVMPVRFTESEVAALQHYANQRTWSISEALRHIIRNRLIAATEGDQA